MSVVRTREQERAAAAWGAVSSVRASLDEYLSLAKNAPAEVLVNGLGQTISFWQAKGRPEHLTLYRQLSDWVLRDVGATGDLLKWVMDSATGSDSYRRATVEALAYLGWVKRLAEARSKDLEREEREGRQEGRHGG